MHNDRISRFNNKSRRRRFTRQYGRNKIYMSEPPDPGHGSKEFAKRRTGGRSLPIHDRESSRTLDNKYAFANNLPARNLKLAEAAQSAKDLAMHVNLVQAAQSAKDLANHVKLVQAAQGARIEDPMQRASLDAKNLANHVKLIQAAQSAKDLAKETYWQKTRRFVRNVRNFTKKRNRFRKIKLKPEKQYDPLRQVYNSIKNLESVSESYIQHYFWVKENRADGNCLFEALSQLLFRKIEEHMKIRQKLCSFILNIDDFNPSNAAEEHLKSVVQGDDNATICRNGSYVSDVAVWIAAFIYEITIVLFTDVQNILPGETPVQHENRTYTVQTFNPGFDIYFMKFSTFARDKYGNRLPGSWERGRLPNHFEALFLKNMTSDRKNAALMNETECQAACRMSHLVPYI